MADLDAVEARIWAHFTAVKRSAHSFRSLDDDLRRSSRRSWHGSAALPGAPRLRLRDLSDRCPAASPPHKSCWCQLATTAATGGSTAATADITTAAVVE